MKTDMVKTYSLLVQFLCHMLGPNYEVVLYDCSNERPVVTSIATVSYTHLTKCLRETDWQRIARHPNSNR